MSALKLAAVTAIGLTLAACAGNPDGSGPGPRENTGTLLGAGTGALLGAAVAGGGTGDRLAGAAIGGLLGGLIGNRIGARPKRTWNMVVSSSTTARTENVMTSA